jgi:hypothetical protein
MVQVGCCGFYLAVRALGVPQAFAAKRIKHLR